MCIGVVDANAKLILHKHEAKYLSYVIVYGIFDARCLLWGFCHDDTYLSLAVKSKQVHFDSNSLRHCLFNDNEASDMSHYDVVRYVSSSFVRIPYKAVITSFRQTFISHSFKCNSSYARFTLSYLSHPTDLTASER